MKTFTAALASAGFLWVLVIGGVLSVATTPKAAVRPSVPMTVVETPRELINPIDGGRLVDTWGAARDGGRRHEGVDIMAPTGTPVRAAASGTIVKLFSSVRGGVTVYQRSETGHLIFYYAHLHSYAPGLREGLRVRQGQVIALVGQSGNATTPHLHFEVHRANAAGQWWRGEAINPYVALKTGRVVPTAVAAAGPTAIRAR